MSLSVALILYDAGLGLDLRRLTGHTRRVVVRLIIVGVPLTWLVVFLVSGPLLGMSRGAALELGAILVVSGPTVVTPLLAFVRPVERLQRVLAWEGSLIDPVGGILGAVVLHGVLAGTHKHFGTELGLFLGSVGVGLAGAIVGTAALWLLLRMLGLGEVLGTSAQLAVVVGVAYRGARALYEVLVRIPVGTALGEEVPFRGALLGVMLRRHSTAAAVARASLCFGLWHVPPTLPSLRSSVLGRHAKGRVGATTAVAAVVAVTAAAGAGFAALRLSTGSVTASALTHTAVNATAYVVARWPAVTCDGLSSAAL